MATTARTICTDAALELQVLSQGEDLSAGDAAYLFSNFTELVDQWNAIRPAVFAVSFLEFTLVPSLNPHTIGPTGATWTVAQRPETIDGMIVELGNGVNAPAVNLDHDADWYQNLSNPTITTSYPTDGYYDPTWPNGSLYLWPIPSTGYSVQVLLRNILGPYTLDTPFSMPPGYRAAMTLTLAETSARPFGKQVTADLKADAAYARSVIFGNNDVTPTLQTADAGLGTQTSTRSNWNWYTGFPL